MMPAAADDEESLSREVAVPDDNVLRVGQIHPENGKSEDHLAEVVENLAPGKDVTRGQCGAHLDGGKGHRADSAPEDRREVPPTEQSAMPLRGQRRNQVVGE